MCVGGVKEIMFADGLRCLLAWKPWAAGQIGGG